MGMCVMFCGCCEKDWGVEEEGLPQEQRDFVNQAVKAEISTAHLPATGKEACLEDFMDRGAWQALVHGVAKESDTTEHTHTHI